MEITKSLRRRANISSSVKGVLTFEVTIDGEVSEEELLKELDSLVSKLKERCPPAIV